MVKEQEKEWSLHSKKLLLKMVMYVTQELTSRRNVTYLMSLENFRW